MAELDVPLTAAQRRIEELEARVKWLEGALTSVLQARRAATPANGTQSPAEPEAEQPAPAKASLELTQPLAVVESRPAQPQVMQEIAASAPRTAAQAPAPGAALSRAAAQLAAARAAVAQAAFARTPDTANDEVARIAPAQSLAVSGGNRALSGGAFSLDDFDDLPQSKDSVATTVVAPVRKPAPIIDPMRFTSAFATLDARLEEQLESETVAAQPVDLGHPVLIDPTLIDLAFAKPPPEKIHVVGALEEHYPHIAKRICTLWGEPELLPFLRKLIVDERGGRQGFPFEVMSELLVLAGLAQAPRDQDAWKETHNAG